MSHFTLLVQRHGPRYPIASSDPGMIECLECPLTRPVLAQSWSRIVLMVMRLLDNRSPERSRPTTTSMGSKAYWFRARNSVESSMAASFQSISLLVVCAGNVELDRYLQLIDAG